MREYTDGLIGNSEKLEIVHEAQEACASVAGAIIYEA